MIPDYTRTTYPNPLADVLTAGFRGHGSRRGGSVTYSVTQSIVCRFAGDQFRIILLSAKKLANLPETPEHYTTAGNRTNTVGQIAAG